MSSCATSWTRRCGRSCGACSPRYGTVCGRGRHLPLQCLIYLPHWQLAPLLRRASSPHPISSTSTASAACRSFPLAPSLPAKRAIVVDMDDLMSRRWPSLRRAGVGLTFGFLERYLPARLLPLLQDGFLARWILGFETRTLRALELPIGGRGATSWCSTRRRMPGSTAARDPPWPEGDRRGGDSAASAELPPVALDRQRRRLRFIFIGTDQIPQNWLSIDHLVEHVAATGPAGGTRHRRATAAHLPGVPQRHLCRVRRRPARRLYRRFRAGDAGIRGGRVKTKVVEAFAYGCPVLGNHATFDGLPLPEELSSRACRCRRSTRLWHIPERHLSSFLVAAEMGQALVNGEVRKVCSSSAGPQLWPTSTARRRPPMPKRRHGIRGDECRRPEPCGPRCPSGRSDAQVNSPMPRSAGTCAGAPRRRSRS